LYLFVQKGGTMPRKRKYEDEVAGVDEVPSIGSDWHAQVEVLDDASTISSASSAESSSSSDSADDSVDFLYKLILWSIHLDDDDYFDMFMILLMAHRQGCSARVIRDTVMAMMRPRVS
jgi:hypothetical protein